MCEHKDIWTGESESASFHCFITPALKLSTNLFAKACKGPPLPSPSAIELAGAGFNGLLSPTLSSRGAYLFGALGGTLSGFRFNGAKHIQTRRGRRPTFDVHSPKVHQKDRGCL